MGHRGRGVPSAIEAVFYRFDGDTLTGRLLAQLVAVNPKNHKLGLETDIGKFLKTWG